MWYQMYAQTFAYSRGVSMIARDAEPSNPANITRLKAQQSDT